MRLDPGYDFSGVPLFAADGAPVVPFTPTPSPTATPVTPDAPPPTATPRVTPAFAPAQLAGPAANLDDLAAPEAEAAERTVVLGGDNPPADPLASLPATPGDTTNPDAAQSLSLDVANAAVQIWSGLLGDPSPGWVDAPGALLWPGSSVRLIVNEAAGDNDRLVVERVRIVAAPPVEARARLVTPEANVDITEGNGRAALLGGEERGLFLLGTGADEATLSTAWPQATDAAWLTGVDGDASSDLLLTAGATNGQHTITWARDDGSALQISAQPFFAIQGAAGDPLLGLWWIETPQANFDAWQLWHYRADRNEISRLAQATGETFHTTLDDPARTPTLLHVIPQEDGALDLLVDSSERISQRPQAGLFRVRIAIDGRLGQPQPLLAADQYASPPHVATDGRWLAYLARDESQPALAGQPNVLRVLSLRGEAVGEVQTVYAAKSEFEFLEGIAWQGDSRLLTTRARMSASLRPDRFGVVQIVLGEGGEPSTLGEPLLPAPQQILSIAPCRAGDALLLAAGRAPDGTAETQLLRWNGVDAPEPVVALPPALTRAALCWGF